MDYKGQPEIYVIKISHNEAYFQLIRMYAYLKSLLKINNIEVLFLEQVHLIIYTTNYLPLRQKI
jgi:hypothetical protein